MNAPDPRDPLTRYHSGFDRWCRDSLRDREITCRMSGEHLHALDQQGNLWFWHSDESVWWQMTEEHQAEALRDHAVLMRMLPKTVPVVRVYLSATLRGEREAARHALGRIGAGVWAIWEHFDPIVEGCSIGRWIVKPSEIYEQVTRCSRWLLDRCDPPSFDEDVLATLREIERKDW